jgi:O-antigen ligase/polysaccharide polymerase Wzy-like membrane protein
MRGVALTVLHALTIISLMVGGASLGRLDSDYAQLGMLGEFRFAFLLAALALTVTYAVANPTPWRASRSTFMWLLGFAALHVLVAGSWIWSVHSEFSDMQAYEVGLLLVTVLLCPYLFYNAPERTTLLILAALYTFGCALVAASLLLSGGFGGETSQLGAGGIGSARIQGLAVIAAIYFTMKSGHARWLVPVPMMLAAMFASGSRAAVFALVPALVFLAWRRPRALVPARRTRWLTVAIIFALPVIFFATPIGRPILLAFVVGNFVSGGDSGESSSLYLADRDVIFAHAVQAFLDRPLLGQGIGTYMGPYGELYPHNMLLSYAVDAGSVALLACCLLIGWGFFRVLLARSPTAGVAGAAAIFYFAASLFAGTFYDARFVWVFLLLAMVLGDVRQLQSRATDLGGVPGRLQLQRAGDFASRLR